MFGQRKNRKSVLFFKTLLFSIWVSNSEEKKFKSQESVLGSVGGV
jgi:hypothetical protein